MNHKEPYNKRKKDNTSELKFEEVMKQNNVPFVRFGIDARDSNVTALQFLKMPKFIRNAPDYVILKTQAKFVEVKGCTETLKLKLSDMASYIYWDKYMPVYFFIYSTTYNNYKFIKVSNLTNLAKKCPVKQFNDPSPTDKKEYYDIPYLQLK